MKYLLCALSLVLFSSHASAAIKRHRIKPKPIPAFSAKSYLIADSDGQIIKEHNGGAIRSIASISKLMVAVLASEQDLDEYLSIPYQRKVQSSIPRKVSKLTRKELLALALVKSDNLAAQILCNNMDRCVERMNDRAALIEMYDTKFVEPTGLDRDNVSTAHDLLKLMMIIVSNEVITELSRLAIVDIPTAGKPIKIRNTNPLTFRLNIILSKTGYTSPAGGCLVMVVGEGSDQRIYVLLGSRNAKTRIPDMEKLVKETRIVTQI